MQLKEEGEIRSSNNEEETKQDTKEPASKIDGSVGGDKEKNMQVQEAKLNSAAQQAAVVNSMTRTELPPHPIVTTSS